MKLVIFVKIQEPRGEIVNKAANPPYYYFISDKDCQVSSTVISMHSPVGVCNILYCPDQGCQASLSVSPKNTTSFLCSAEARCICAPSLQSIVLHCSKPPINSPTELVGYKATRSFSHNVFNCSARARSPISSGDKVP